MQTRKEIDATVNSDQTVTVEFRGEQRTFNAVYLDKRVVVRNVVSGKFRTGKKLWPMDLWIHENGNACIGNGGFSNKGGVASICGWWNSDGKANTQHRGAM